MNFYKHYIGDYQRDTGHLSMTEHGAYRLMLDAFYATNKPLPLDRKALYRLLRADGLHERAAVDSVIKQFWHESCDGFINDRAMEEIVKADKQAQTNRGIAITREAARLAKRSEHDMSTNRLTNDEPNHSHSHNQEPIKETKSKTLTHLAMLTSLGIEDRVAKDWLAIRKVKKLPLTQTGLDAIVKSVAEAGLSMNEAIKICCERSWAGFKREWLDQDRKSSEPENIFAGLR